MNIQQSMASPAFKRGLPAFIGMLAICLTSILAIIYVPNPLVSRMIQNDLRANAELWHKRILQYTEAGGSTFQSAHVTEADREFLKSVPRTSDLFRLSLFDASGNVFWSTRAADIGEKNESSFFDTELNAGATHYQTDLMTSDQIDFLDTHSRVLDKSAKHLVAELFTPVFVNGQFEGAIEFFVDITDMHATFLARVRAVLIGAAMLSGLVLLFVSMVIVNSHRTRTAAMKHRTDQDRDSMEQQLKLAREVRVLGELNEWLQSSRSLDELFDMVTKFLVHLLPNCAGSIYVYSNSRDVLDGASSWNGGTLKEHIRPDECWGLRRGRTYRYGSTEIEFTCEHAEPHDHQPYFCFPILAHGETVGLMHLKALEGTDIEEFKASQKLAQLCAEQISMAIANVRMRDQLQDQSIRDPLTGLYNRRHMNDTLRQAFDRYRSKGDVTSVISVDVDHFKKFNDNHGHDAGDMVLRAVGEVLIQSCDGNDVACRPGGEEFALILQNTDVETALVRAEALRQAVENVSVRYGEKTLPRITISLGVAACPDAGTLPQDVLRAADDALHAAKAQGRNRVCLAGDTAAEDPKIPPQIAAE